ncbi:unnamed protein product [Oppiella nova]|uniref:Protein kinase domain-containing protein n=1 Tax=Oppiella nova TaxID=334625 RepID=A0A7R9LFT5_9ACAR|nr:unnamed protein product [Oppiella nova]CAG2163121.1 unnamed protein product [Oppiella nova]
MSPKLIPYLTDIKAISSASRMTCFLSNTGALYYCGDVFPCPKLTPTQIQKVAFHDMSQLRSYSNFTFVPVVLGDKVYKIDSANERSESKHADFISFYAEECQITYNTRRVHHNHYLYKFNEIQKIGQGGFGSVYKVMNLFDQKIYAVKCVPFEDTKNKGKVIREIKNLATVNSNFVVKYYDSWIERQCLYIQMELCLDSLNKILALKPQVFNRQLDEPMSLYEYFISCEIFRQLLECVQYLHGLDPQIIHRDLKPDNILISVKVKNDRFIKLCDFGLATMHDKRIHYITANKHTADVGDVRYMAPEIIQGMKYGHKSDLYSLALIGGEIFSIDLFTEKLMSIVTGNVARITISMQNSQYIDELTVSIEILQDLLDSMINLKWEKRPECWEVLAKYSEWSIDNSLDTNDLQFKATLETLESHENPFFNKFLLNILQRKWASLSIFEKFQKIRLMK